MNGIRFPEHFRRRFRKRVEVDFGQMDLRRLAFTAGNEERHVIRRTAGRQRRTLHTRLD